MMLRDNRNMFHAFDEFSLKVAVHYENLAIQPVRLDGTSRRRLRTRWAEIIKSRHVNAVGAAVFAKRAVVKFR